jgi:nucleotide-binding universal stress UspA family protein
MKKILCVIDFRGGEVKTLEVAAEIAVAVNAHLLVLYPYRLIGESQGDIPSLKRKLEADARKRFEETRSRTKAIDRLSVEFQPEIGFAVDRILAHTRGNNIDMVVIGQEVGAGEWKSLPLTELIAHSNVPFVVVPSEEKSTVPL